MASIGTIAGYLSAFVVTGIGGRIVMRIIAIADPSTEPDVSGGGTMLIMMVGATMAGLAGALGGLIFMAIRHLLPGSWMWSGMGFGVLWLAVAGWLFFVPIQFESFFDFEPPGLGMGLFAGLYILYGVALAGLVKLLDLTVPGVRQI